VIEFCEGDLFAIKVDARVNTVNCVGIMGAGVALAFKNRYPKMYLAYRQYCEAGKMRPGKLLIWKSPEGELIINFPTKRHWRNKSQLEDIESGLVSLRDYLLLPSTACDSITVPALGCGHGGLDWSVVSVLIESHLADLPLRVYAFGPQSSKMVGKIHVREPQSNLFDASVSSDHRSRSRRPKR
jgi:O-acetyl-ADP-ribose deacetylase (regulator of RNase III)